jgi:hypothetical protein
MVGLQIIVGHEGPYNSHGPIAYRMVGHNGVGRTLQIILGHALQ